MIELKNAKVFSNGKFECRDVIAEADGIEKKTADVYIFPGFVDVHVHFRQPGFEYKETIFTGSRAAAAGGYTAVCTMPNLKPVPDCTENIKAQLDIIEKDARIKVFPYAAITENEEGMKLSDFNSLKDFCIAFSDDGKGVQDENMMKTAMLEAKKYNKIIAAHCEDNSLLKGGYIHDGEYAALYGHRGICSESEWGQIKRDLRLAKETGCAYHVCHISTAESVELIRRAKAEGVNVTCETAPHYLVFNDMDLKDEGRFKMNPPIRSERDRNALIDGIKDGTIDMIATDHAPHSAEEKSRGLEKSLMGVVGLETAFSALYTHLVKKNVITLEKLIELMSVNPSKRFGIPTENSFTVFELGAEREINSDKFLSKGKSSPFDGKKLFGKCMLTVSEGKPVYICEEWKN